MSAVVDSERKGHKRKLADTFTYSSAVAGHTGGEKDNVPAQVQYDSFSCLNLLLYIQFKYQSTVCR